MKFVNDVDISAASLQYYDTLPLLKNYLHITLA